jgi:drug/metabolite transporter (DMT)-like permease
MPAHTPQPGPMDTTATAVMLVLCAVWALQQVSLKAVAPHANPMLVVALRSVVALGLLAILMRQRGEALLTTRWRPGLLAGTLFGLEYLLVTEALRWTSASHVVVFLYTAPLFAALGLHLGLPAERLGRRQVVGMLTAFLGIALAFGGVPSTAPTGPAQAWWGDALALMAGVAWGATTVTLRCTRLASAPATETLLYQLAGAAVLPTLGTALTGNWWLDNTPTVWAHVGFQALVVSFASFLVWCWLLRRYLASRLGVLSFLTPVLGVLLGVVLLGERITPGFASGAACVLVGVVVVSWTPTPRYHGCPDPQEPRT